MLNFFYRARNKKGFTLIELIVVIAILGILALIAIPRFANVRGTANQGVAISNLTNIQRAAEMAAATTNKDIGDVTEDELNTALGQDIDSMDGQPAGSNYSWDVVNGIASVAGISVPGPLGAAFDYEDIVSN